MPGRGEMQWGRYRESYAGSRRRGSAQQSQGRGGRRFGDSIQAAVPQPLALLHRDFCAVFIGRHRMVGDIAMHTLVEMQKTAVVDPHRAGVDVDERRHRLQGDKQPEHQEAEDSVRHSQAGNIYG